MCKQYWAAAATKNCVWCFQIKEERYDGEGNAVESWRTETIFLTEEEAMAHGNSRLYAWGKYQEGWRIWGVMCKGLMAELLGKHNKEFEDKVEYISN